MCFIPRLLCRVEWYTGDVTKEIITGETDEMYIFDYKENHSYSRINYFSGGDEMKSMNETIRDEIFVKELEEMKKIINDDNF